MPPSRITREPSSSVELCVDALESGSASILSLSFSLVLALDDRLRPPRIVSMHQIGIK